MQQLKTISLESSNLTWNDVDDRARQLGLDRSKYTQRLYEKDLTHSYRNHLAEIAILLIIALQSVILLTLLR